MKTNKFAYEVFLHIELTCEELDLIQNCAKGHYDLRVRRSALQGGFIYGWRNRLKSKEDGDAWLLCSFEELDTCAKALEQPASLTESDKDVATRWQLRGSVVDSLNGINNQTRRVNEAIVVTAEVLGMSM